MNQFVTARLLRLLATLTVLLALTLSVTPGALAQVAASTVAAFSLGPDTVDVTLGNRVVTFQAHLIDPGGVQVAQMIITDANGVSHGVTLAGVGSASALSGTAQDGVYTAPLTVYQYSAAGTWHVSSLYLQGPSGNRTLSEQDLVAQGFKTTFLVVVNPCIPHLTGFSFTPSSTDVTFGDQPVSVSVGAQDTECGIAYVHVSFDAPPSCQGPEAKQTLIYTPSSGDSHAGTYTGQVSIPQYDVHGPWGVTVTVADNSGDIITLGPTQLQEMGFPGYLQVRSAISPCENVTVAGTVYASSVGATPMPGVTLTLTEADGTAVETATTDGSGHYAFTGLATGTFGVAETVPVGYTAVSANPGTGSGGMPTNAARISVTAATDGAIYPSNDFVLGLAKSDSIGGTVYILAEGGKPAPGVRISLTSAGATVGTATTDTNGRYSFGPVAPGLYTVTETVPPGDTALSANPGSGGTAAGTTAIRVAATATNTAYQPNDFVLGKLNTSGCYRTLTQCDLFAPASFDPAAAFFSQNFGGLYPHGVQIGDHYTVRLTCPSAVRCFVPQFWCPSALCQNYVDPSWWCFNDSLAGDVLALQVSVDLSNAGATRNGLASQPGLSCGPLAGLNIGQLLRLGNHALGGGAVNVPLSTIDSAIASVLCLYHNCGRDD